MPKILAIYTIKLVSPLSLHYKIYEACMVFPNPLNLYEECKSKPSLWHIVVCTFLIVTTKHQHEIQCNRVLPQCTGQVCFFPPAVIMVVCFNVLWRTVMDYDFNPLTILPIDIGLLVLKSYVVIRFGEITKTVLLFYSLSIVHHILFRSLCIIQDNLFYLTVNNNIFVRQKGRRAKVRFASPLTTYT